MVHYVSLSDFRVHGKKVDASAPGVIFEYGTAGQLASGVNVTVQGDQVVNDVLIVTQVRFD